jgi:dTDP-4-amino-4,6-dideoxygalactose transaminase
VPVADPGAENALLVDELEAAIRRVTSSGTYTLGPEVEAFERDFAEFTGARFAVAVASGTDAITLALRAFDIGPGDEVLSVSHTAGATAAGILRAGATPVLVDVDPLTLTLAPEGLEAALTERTRAILPVHLYGGAADLRSIREFARRNALTVIEDCAQAHGTRIDGEHVGAGAGAGTFSFYPTKNLAALGDGGAVITSLPEIHEKLVSLRQYGWRIPQVSETLGWNSRLDELQAAVLRVKLRQLPGLLQGRRGAAASYAATITADQVALPTAHEGVEHSYHLYVIRTSHRDALADHLRERDIATAIHYPVPVHNQPGYARLCVAQPIPETERAVSEILSLPMFSAISRAAIDRVVASVNSFTPLRRTVAR